MMNLINILSTAVIIICSASGLLSQDYTHALTNIKKIRIETGPGLIVIQHDENVFLIKSQENAKHQASAQDITPSYDEGMDNTGFGVMVQEAAQVLVVKNLKDERASDLVVYVPGDMDLSVAALSFNKIEIRGFSSEIEVLSKEGDILLEEITGPVVANSESGDIHLSFAAFDQSSPSSLITGTGDLYLTISEKTAVQLKLMARSGVIYVDGKAKNGRGLNKEEQRELYELLSLVEGGTEIRVLASSGNIYLLKKATK